MQTPRAPPKMHRRQPLPPKATPIHQIPILILLVGRWFNLRDLQLNLDQSNGYTKTRTNVSALANFSGSTYCFRKVNNTFFRINRIAGLAGSHACAEVEGVEVVVVQETDDPHPGAAYAVGVLRVEGGG